MLPTREVEKAWNLRKFDLWPAITGLNIELEPKIIPPIASTRRVQSTGLFRIALRRFVWKRQGGGRTNPPLHRRRWQNTVYGPGLRAKYYCLFVGVLGRVDSEVNLRPESQILQKKTISKTETTMFWPCIYFGTPHPARHLRTSFAHSYCHCVCRWERLFSSLIMSGWCLKQQNLCLIRRPMYRVYCVI